MQSLTVLVMSMLISLSLVSQNTNAQTLSSKQRQLYCNDLLAGDYRYGSVLPKCCETLLTDGLSLARIP